MRLSKRDKALTRIEIPVVHSIYFRGKRYKYSDYLKIKGEVNKNELLPFQKKEVYLLLIIKIRPELINTKETVPIKNQSLDSYLYIIASPNTQRPELNKIKPKKAPKYLFIFKFIFLSKIIKFLYG